MPIHVPNTSFALLLAALLAAFLFTSCQSQQAPGKEEQALRTAALGYLNAMANYDFDAAIPYASQETRVRTIPLIHSILASTDSSFLKDYMPASIQIDSIQIQDSTATVFFTKTMPLGKRRQQLNMICRDDKWQAHVLTSTPEALKSHKPLTNDDIKQMKIQKVERTSISSNGEQQTK